MLTIIKWNIKEKREEELVQRGKNAIIESPLINYDYLIYDIV